LEDATEVQQPDAKPKLVIQKYETIMYRYYYYIRFHKMPFDKALIQLEQEFYISSGRIADVLVGYAGAMKKITKAAPTLQQLNEKYPHYSWQKPKK